ncbi:hypothetical protein L1987_09548 [Smallanthus sonchifolius]|uniref:Uncharacterized protein n=1 Tax=Smallanthus sonchifolius TaxID=185202 RepID=A0ACB9JNP9_9ASTR|nr:hypothetical protein L1987_09548 [Smallanthus sonchifolius]
MDDSEVMFSLLHLKRRPHTLYEVVIGIDVVASKFYGEKNMANDLNFKEENNDGKEKILGEQLKDLYKSFVSEYLFVSIEDPFDQDDWEHYAMMTAECGDKYILWEIIFLWVWQR